AQASARSIPRNRRAVLGDLYCGWIRERALRALHESFQCTARLRGQAPGWLSCAHGGARLRGPRRLVELRLALASAASSGMGGRAEHLAAAALVENLPDPTGSYEHGD